MSLPPIPPYSHYEFESVHFPPNRERLYYHHHLIGALNPFLPTDRASPIPFGEDQVIHFSYPNGSLPDRFSVDPLSPNTPRGFQTHSHISELPRSNIPSPIDMQSQDDKKREIKRERNRAAAQRCRKKKLEKIAALEHKVKISKEEINNLTAELLRLKDDVNCLKKSIEKHQNNGCVLDVSRFEVST